MIRVNDYTVERNHFPDRTQLLKVPLVVANESKPNIIYWKYECDEEMVTLYYIVNHLRNNLANKSFVLNLAYIPNARMDRVKNSDEVFTLKYFCDFINDLNFDTVIVSDPHSNVSAALLNRVCVKPCRADEAYKILFTQTKEMAVVYYPDNGAMKRYVDLGCDCPNSIKYADVVYGEKKRDWRTGKIEGLEVKTQNGVSVEDAVKGRDVLMIDDIISYGGTMYYSALELKKLGARNIYIYCSHLENSVLDKEHGTLIGLLDDGTVATLFTDSDSIFTLEHKSIKTI